MRGLLEFIIAFCLATTFVLVVVSIIKYNDLIHRMENPIIEHEYQKQLWI